MTFRHGTKRQEVLISFGRTHADAFFPGNLPVGREVMILNYGKVVIMRVIFRQSPCIPAQNDIIVDGEKLTIREELAKTRYALENAYLGFDNVTDPDLIDCYIYELNSVMKRYKYLLQQAAEMNLLPEEERAEAYRPLAAP